VSMTLTGSGLRKAMAAFLWHVLKAKRRGAGIASPPRTLSLQREILNYDIVSRFAKFSLEERLEGSLHAFAWSDVAEGSTPIRSITERRSLSPSSSTRTAIDSPCGLSSHRERYGLTVFRLFAGVGKALSLRR
jgi:hypothetical protein